MTMRLIIQISQALPYEMFDGYPYLKRTEITLCKLSQHPLRLVLQLGIKMNLKQNALHGFKLLPHDSGSHITYEIHMSMFPQATTRNCKKYFGTANYSRISHGSLPQRG